MYKATEGNQTKLRCQFRCIFRECTKNRTELESIRAVLLNSWFLQVFCSKIPWLFQSRN